jgi:acetolactate synthase-1/2/3 large subunit
MSENGQHAQAELRAADYLIRRLADMGIQELFFLPGGGAMFLNDALACEPRLKPVVCHHEQACGIAAEAWGRTHPAGFGVAMVTTGPGATNVLTPLVGAWIESLPLLVVSGQVKRSDALAGRALRQGGVQEVDIVSMVKPVCKFARTVQAPEDIRAALEEALWHMRSGRPGPVWLDIPLDVQAAPVDAENLRAFTPPDWPGGDSRRFLSASEGAQRLKGLLESSQRPLILAGHGVRIAGGSALLPDLARRWGIPCTFTWNAADLMPWDDPLYVGRPGVVAARAPNFAVQNCDLLISLGCRLDAIVTAYNPMGFARGAAKVVVDVDANELSRHPFEVSLPVCDDAAAFLHAWAELTPTGQQAPERWAPWRQRCRQWKQRYPATEGRALGEAAEPVAPNPYAFVDVLSDVLEPGDLVVTGSSGLAIEVFYTVFRNKSGQRVFLTSGLGSMGYGLPAAIGACLGANKRPTICVESDGSLMLNLQELATLKALQLPITLVIVNNAGYSSIRNTQRHHFQGRFLGTGAESGLYVPDLAAVARAMGLPAVTVSNLADFRAAWGQRPPGPNLIEMQIRPHETLSPKAAALPQPDGSMLSMPLEDMTPLLSLEQLRQEMLVALTEQSIRAVRPL